MGRIIMKSFTYIFLALLLSNSSFAVEIPNQFEDGQVTSASQMNENFQALKVEIEALKAQLEQSQNPPKVEFQGYSEPISGNSGIAEFNAACEALSSGSRMCVGDELINSIFEYPSNSAWVARNRTHANVAAGYGPYRDVWYGKTSSCISDGIPHHINANGKFYDSLDYGCHPLSIYPIACCK